MFNKNPKIVKKEIEKTPEVGKIPCSWIGSIYSVKMAILPEVIHRFNAIVMEI